MSKQEGNCILIGAGDLTVSEIPIQEKDLCIAVDGGYEYCQLLGIEPDYILGDFDSVSEATAGQLEEISRKEPGKVIRIPVVKDDTDTLAALKLGLEKGYRSFRIYAATGGRLEHTLANIQCLLYLKEKDAVGYLVDGTGMILAARQESIGFKEDLEGYLSLFSMGEKAVVSIENMKYCLEKAELTNHFPLGVSNEFIGKKGQITVHQGEVLILITYM